MVDTNTDPRKVDFPIPANDDASKSIDIILRKVAEAVQQGLEERKAEKEKVKEEDTEQVQEESVAANEDEVKAEVAETVQSEQSSEASDEEENNEA
ncbi:unnamed protein product [Cyprideis torosa]|uniref:Uncharacterized protein n=1 Tax=Cyprideis torosa TaxID=163714 RepID=A0A7R8ZYQ5_9CRUS|nr:unnamed protein product [Cyprideis torosa]CAG0908857.1 unnamed protein product [Cyprideis torosa]